jgi:3-deoxy-manno-octulosonate cytidylyltransferase (CMP-KDO synthetase)
MIIIPARLNSSRFQNKILVDILGLPMVIRTAKQVSSLDDVTIATDSANVIALAKEHGINAIMTSSEHQSGTDRINEAAKKLNLKEDDIVINVQADEPFIEVDVIKAVINRVKEVRDNKEDIMIVSCHKKISSQLADDPNHVKVLLNDKGNATYFSRSKIPYHRDHYEHATYNGHLGIYGFTVKSLDEFCKLPSALTEGIEKLEQLRAIYHEKKIAMVEVQSKSFGIDTEEDLKNALNIFAK